MSGIGGFGGLEMRGRAALLALTRSTVHGDSIGAELAERRAELAAAAKWGAELAAAVQSE